MHQGILKKMPVPKWRVSTGFPYFVTGETLERPGTLAFPFSDLEGLPRAAPTTIRALRTPDRNQRLDPTRGGDIPSPAPGESHGPIVPRQDRPGTIGSDECGLVSVGNGFKDIDGTGHKTAGAAGLQTSVNP